MQRRIRSALLGAGAVVQLALGDVVALVAATAALLPLAVRGRPVGERRRALEQRPLAEERRAAVEESPTGSS